MLDPFPMTTEVFLVTVDVARAVALLPSPASVVSIVAVIFDPVLDCIRMLFIASIFAFSPTFTLAVWLSITARTVESAT